MSQFYSGSLFICDRKSIKQYLKQHDVAIGRKTEFSIRHESFIDSQTVIRLPEEDYIVEIRKQINGYCGSIKILGSDSAKGESLLNDFFNKTGAVRVSEDYFRIFLI